MARWSRPVAPRLSAPDLPTHLEDGPTLACGGDHFPVRWTSLDAQTDAGSLRGVTLSSRQIEYLAPALAAAAGIHVLD
jgi:hypothetical protein